MTDKPVSVTLPQLECVVRPARLEDAAAIAAIHAAARHVGYREFVDGDLLSRMSSNQLEAIWRERLGGSEPPTVFVATQQEQLAGYCMVLTPSEDADSGGVVAELTRMSVSPDAWRSGVGTALTTAALSFLRQDSWQAVSLWVLEQNTRAHRFYSALGFHEDGAQTTDPWTGQTQLRMRLALNGKVSNP